jgi:hypothetical protein
MNKLFNNLPKDEVNEEEAIYTVGDSLLYQFYCGNWSASVKEMTDNNYSTTDLIKYINSLDACIGGWLDWFDREFFAELGASTVKLN